MKAIGFVGMIAALFLSGAEASVGTSTDAARIGDTYEITLIRESLEKGDGGGSSGSSYDKDTIIERLVATRPDGLELEYDLPKDATADERAGNWQFPARVFKPSGGPMQLLNGQELESRVDRWLKDAKWPRSVCGHWIFTWNAFRIECDPQSVLKTAEKFDLRSADLRDGASYRDADAKSPGKLVRNPAGPNGVSFIVGMPINPEVVVRGEAESDVVVGEIMKKPVTLEAALHERAKETISGTISITFDADSAGNAYRRTRLIKLEIKRSDGRTDTKTITETLERRLVSAH